MFPFERDLCCIAASLGKKKKVSVSVALYYKYTAQSPEDQKKLSELNFKPAQNEFFVKRATNGVTCMKYLSPFHSADCWAVILQYLTKGYENIQVVLLRRTKFISDVAGIYYQKINQ